MLILNPITFSTKIVCNLFVILNIQCQFCWILWEFIFYRYQNSSLSLNDLSDNDGDDDNDEDVEDDCNDNNNNNNSNND